MHFKALQQKNGPREWTKAYILEPLNIYTPSYTEEYLNMVWPYPLTCQ